MIGLVNVALYFERRYYDGIDRTAVATEVAGPTPVAPLVAPSGTP